MQKDPACLQADGIPSKQIFFQEIHDDAGEEDHSAPYQEKPSNCKHDREECDDAYDVEGLFPPRDGLYIDEFDMDPAPRRLLSIFFPLFIQGESMVVLHILFGHASRLFMDFRVV